MAKDGNLLRISQGGGGGQLQATQNATKTLKTTLKAYQFLHYINIWNQKMQTSVFYEALLSITWNKPRAAVTKCSKCMRHISRDITMTRTVRIVRLLSTCERIKNLGPK